MKNLNRRMKALLLAFIASTTITFAQTTQERQRISDTYNRSKLNQLQQDFKQKADRQKAEALAMAAQKGWEVLRSNPDGSVDELMAVSPMGAPIYYTVFNEDAARSTVETDLPAWVVVYYMRGTSSHVCFASAAPSIRWVPLNKMLSI